MNILAAIIAPPHLAVGGGAKAGEQLSAALAQSCKITLASMMRPQLDPRTSDVPLLSRAEVRSWLPPVAPWRQLPNRYATLFYRSNLPDIVRQGRYDLVHLHNPMPALEMARVAAQCRALALPYVVSTHGFNEIANGDQIYGFDRARQLLWKHLVQEPVARVVRRAAGIFALSPADFDIVQRMGYRGPELTIVSNGVAVNKPVGFDTIRNVCAQFGIAPSRDPARPVCLFLANHTPNKGLPILLAAFAASRQPMDLVIAGERRSDIAYDAAIQSCRPGQRLIVTGRLDDTAVSALFARTDLFVLPTLADTFPLVVLEAMAHGVPVIATRVGGIPHQVSAQTGILVDPANAEQLRVAIETLAADPQVRAEMGRKARARVETEFTWAAAAANAKAAYHRVLERHRADAAARAGVRSTVRVADGATP